MPVQTLSRVLLPLAALGLAAAPAAAATPEAIRVAQEACGDDPQPKCLMELRKVCHELATFRCYYSRKSRLDALRQIGFPEDRPRLADE